MENKIINNKFKDEHWNELDIELQDEHWNVLKWELDNVLQREIAF